MPSLYLYLSFSFWLAYNIYSVATVSDLMEIHPTTFICDGTESSLSDCMPGAGTGSQTHQSDAYISCQTSEAIYIKI